MNLAVALEVVGAHLDAARHLDAVARAEGRSPIQAARGVVVRERDARDAALARLFEHLLEGVRAVRHGGMHVEVGEADLVRPRLATRCLM